MAAGKFGPSGPKMTMKAPQSSSSSAPRAGPSQRKGAPSKGKQPAKSARQDESDSEDDRRDDDQISLENGDDDEPDTEDEIEAAKGAGSKSKKTAKRKRRATSPTSFGSALEGLLGIAPSASADALETLDEDEEEVDAEEEASKKAKKSKTASSKSEASVPAILSLAPHLRRSAQSTTLSARAARIALEQKRRREERSHIKDVIGGWGPPGVLPALEDEDGNIIETFYAENDEQRLEEFASQGGSQVYERKLRKVAQRGVVKLFNAIRAAQTTTEDDLEEVEAKKSAAAAAGKVKASAVPAKKAGLASKDARLADLSKSNFLDLIKKSAKGKGSGVAAK
ncbi:Protein of unknown function DUF1665 [Kalmanozyma brasiliensis GHG001]|uniref:Rrp15p-domain-containing protein n=1 Tax=Kalmanozyma brasiliensis (strain GHG001) TaxID=1365824 RepID=V5EWM2_KALBG|nr:Protein of unknown function DUF1665 [Kalmanozyma brasiliensis GHG001]EST09985.1 Protein of unknown function DUF1665 [Kalmanozyma brasiliensis GHG001]